MNRLHVTRTSHHTTSHRTIHCRPQYKDTSSTLSNRRHHGSRSSLQASSGSGSGVIPYYYQQIMERMGSKAVWTLWRRPMEGPLSLLVRLIDHLFSVFFSWFYFHLYALLLTLISWYFHHCIPKNIRSGDTSRHITISITQRPDNARLALPQRYCRIRRRGINLHISIRHFHQGILLSDVTINWWGIISWYNINYWNEWNNYRLQHWKC